MRVGSISGYNPYSAYNSYDFGDVFKTATNAINAGKEGDAGKVSADPAHQVAPGRKSSPAECETCRTRKYQDGSDEADVSFKAPGHISPSASRGKVMAHEMEHVANAYQKEADGKTKVLSASVSLHTATCPECGTTYVAGGETRTVTATQTGDDKPKNPYDQNNRSLVNAFGSGGRFDAAL